MSTKLPSMMRAAQASTTSGGIENAIRIANIPVPSLQGKDTVLIKVSYSSLNPVDVKVPESFVGHFFSKPLTMGVDYSGNVVQSNCAKYKAGDRVYGVTKTIPFGALTEYIVNEGAQRMIECPDTLSLRDASTIGVAALTAYQSLVPFVKAGDKVLINGGSGGVGTFAIQIAKILGCTVTAVCSGANVELCKSLGADEVLDYKSKPLVEQLKLPGRAQFDYLLDCIFPDTALYFQAHHYLKKGGKFATIAGSPTWKFVKEMCAVGFKPSFLGGGQRAFKVVMSSANAEECDKISEWFVQGKLKAVVEQEFELDEAAEAYRKLKTGRTRGKIVVKVAGG
ncbi:hypothetical protein AMS68_000012 [Peltaster fructicola]|uniref:Enoyl reductase (ER) domain-containing protein n=1 Tax=Peltaster fructicola TaxID=286661 RepID=A0A6H0XIP3_9PEZI|nr:hypothetical protein AMS68_000012 [Peltaster fructicola]